MCVRGSRLTIIANLAENLSGVNDLALFYDDLRQVAQYDYDTIGRA